MVVYVWVDGCSVINVRGWATESLGVCTRVTYHTQTETGSGCTELWENIG